MPLGARIRHLLALALPRWLAVALRIRRLTPGAEKWPERGSFAVAAQYRVDDTGGGYRATQREQNPAVDPAEPTNESGSAGENHGWSNCTLASSATALAYQQPYGSKTPWGGHLRHRQSDQSGGTDLYDAKEAWASYGETLTIKSGTGWGALVDVHQANRAIVIQGTGNVPGSASFDGGHACVIAPETHSDGRWLFGDPLVAGWQWINPSAIKEWAQRWDSDISYAAGEAPPAPKPPEPTPPPTPAPAPASYNDGYREGHADGVVDGRNIEADATFASWFATRPRSYWDTASWAGTPPDAPTWSDPFPTPLGAVIAARSGPAAWGGSGWTASLWEG